MSKLLAGIRFVPRAAGGTNRRPSLDKPRASSWGTRSRAARTLGAAFWLAALVEPGFGGDCGGLLFNTVMEQLADPAFQAPGGVSPRLKERIGSYRVRLKAFRSGIAARAASEGPERALETQRRCMERGIVALVDAAGIETLAAAYAAEAKLYYEWEGMSEAPAAEAAFAEEFLKRNPGTVMRPYLELFLAHRYKCVAETLARQQGPAYQKALADFRRHVEACRRHPDPLVRFIAGSVRRRPFLYLDPALHAPGGRPDPRPGTAFEAEIRAGERFERVFGPGYLIRLEPSDLGWFLSIRERGRNEDLSRMTPPFHGVPNPREIEGWHFRNADNTGPNEAGSGNVNAPGEFREFIFSPEVGRSIAGPHARSGPTPEQIEKVRAFGRGSLRILEIRLGDLTPGKRARIEWMRFRVELWWRPDP